MTSTSHRSSASSPTASGSTADTGPDEAHMFVRHTVSRAPRWLRPRHRLLPAGGTGPPTAPAPPAAA